MGRRGGALGARVVERQIEPPEVHHAPRDHRGHRLVVGHVGRHEQRGAALVGDLRGDLFAAVEVLIGDDDRRSRLGQRERRGAADPRAAARDDRDLPEKLVHLISPRRNR
jgi:hypothetical protein